MEKGLPLPPPLEESVPVGLFKGQVVARAERIGVAPVSATVRPRRRKWASCSSAGRLTSDRDLLGQPAAFRAKVIVHDPLHLKHPRHGKTFRVLVKAYLARCGVGE